MMVIKRWAYVGLTPRPSPCAPLGNRPARPHGRLPRCPLLRNHGRRPWFRASFPAQEARKPLGNPRHEKSPSPPLRATGFRPVRGHGPGAGSCLGLLPCRTAYDRQQHRRLLGGSVTRLRRVSPSCDLARCGAAFPPRPAHLPPFQRTRYRCRIRSAASRPAPSRRARLPLTHRPPSDRPGFPSPPISLLPVAPFPAASKACRLA